MTGSNLFNVLNDWNGLNFLNGAIGGPMVTVVAILVALLLVSIPGRGSGAASADQDFYRGKTIRIIVGFSAGGGFDQYSRIIARHMPRHIPGNPTMIVDNMGGAGSRLAANFLFKAAAPDGLTIGNFIGSLLLQQILGDQGIEFDGRRFEWLGVPVQDENVCALTKASGVTSLEQWFAAKKPVKLGGEAPGANDSDVPRMLQATLKLPIQLIEGYKGTSFIRIAAESGEVDGGCWTWASIRSTWKKGIDSQGSVSRFANQRKKSRRHSPGSQCHRFRQERRSQAIDRSGYPRVFCDSPGLRAPAQHAARTASYFARRLQRNDEG